MAGSPLQIERAGLDSNRIQGARSENNVLRKRRKLNFSAIPEELKHIPQWILWKHLSRNGKPTKPPCNATGKIVDAQDSANWLPFDKAKAAFERNTEFDGVGLVLTPDLNLVGVDLDHCVDPTGTIEPWAAEIVGKMASYAEISPSGSGVRVFVKGTLPEGSEGNKKGKLEMYRSGRYLTVTGNRLPPSLGIIANQPAINAVFREYFTQNPQPQTAPERTKSAGNNLTDAELLDKAKAAMNGDKFSSLWSGDFSGYGSQSEADLALCQLLAFWTDKDTAAMDRLFRQCGLFRSKWDQKRGAQTYGQRTIQKAIKRTTETFASRGLDGSSRPTADEDTPDYFAGKTGLFWNKRTKDGPLPIRLSNFLAKIISEVVHDDGQERRIFFDMEAELRGRRFPFQLPASRFSAMNWPSETLGAAAIIEPGQSMKDRARAAIQTISGDVPRAVLFTHTGWRKFPEGWVYLHANGALSANGPMAKMKTDLGQLDDFTFLNPPTGEDLIRIINQGLDFFAALPSGVGWPLFLSVFRAILAEADAPDVSPWVAGPTGAFKSEIATIVQSFFGVAMADKRRLPGAWSSTANALERLSFLAKDALLVIDDFAPTGTTADIARLNRDAERVLRGAGNRSGRGRLNPDGTLRKTYFPRGLILGTGEDIPAGHSLRARLLTVELKPREVTSDLLSRGQNLAYAGDFNRLAAAFVVWTAGRLEELKEGFPKRKAQLRERIGVAGHARYASTVADFLTTAETFRHFAQDMGAMTADAGAEWLQQIRTDLVTLAGNQGEYLASEDPSQRFFQLLASAFNTVRGYLADAVSGGRPAKAELWGWERKEGSEERYFPKGERLGWVAGEDVYLDPDAAFAAVQKLGRDQGGGIPVSQTRLWKTLKDRGFLQSHEAKRNLAKVTICDTRRRVLHLHAEQIFQRAGVTLFAAGSENAGTSRTQEIAGENREGRKGQEWVSA